MRWVTPTGRALKRGRTTRKSKSVRTRQRGQERPLPFAMQCHPQALDRTPMHPQCFTYRHDSGAFIYYRNLAESTGNTTAFGRGEWLSGLGTYKVVVDGYGEFRHDDLMQALGWCRAAKSYGFKAEVYQQ